MTPRARQLELALCIALAVVCVAAVWIVPRQTGDLYIAYAGARDVLDGKLGLADDWSFANPGRRWVNQNWGTHLLYYGAFHFAGPPGIVALKLALLVLMATALVLLIREHGASRPVALLVAAAVIAAGHAYIDLRPNLITLTLCPVVYWLLLRTRRDPSALWAAVAVTWLWGNMHAGFIVGIALLGLWCLVQLLPPRPWRQRWPFVAAPVAAIVLVGFGNPFGLENLTHPFVAGTSAVWREVVEWMPLFTAVDVDEQYGSRVEFLAACALLAVFAVGRLLHRVQAARLDIRDVVLGLFASGLCVLIVSHALPVHTLLARDLHAAAVATPQPDGARLSVLRQLARATAIPLYAFALVALAATYALARVAVALRRRRAADARTVGDSTTRQPDAATLTFEVIAAAFVVAMALTSRRFIPLAMIMMAPLLALHVEWLNRYRPLPIAAAVIAVAVPVLLSAARDARHYRSDNPRHPSALSSTYDRMLYNDTYPHGAAAFIDRNGIAGRAYEDWRWEGFLHWRCPRLELDVGGRAQQAYDEASYRRRMAIWTGTDAATGRPIDRAAALARQQIRWVIVSLRTDASGLVGALLSPASPWTIVYFDRETNVVLGDRSAPEVADVVGRLVDATLWFPDDATAALSRGLGMSTLGDLAPERRRDALVAANARLPKVAAYHRLVEMERRGELGREWLLAYLRSEWDRLASVRGDAHETLDTLRTRHRVGELLLDATRDAAAAPAPAEVATLAAEVRRLATELSRIEREWPP